MLCATDNLHYIHFSQFFLYFLPFFPLFRIPPSIVGLVLHCIHCAVHYMCCLHEQPEDLKGLPIPVLHNYGCYFTTVTNCKQTCMHAFVMQFHRKKTNDDEWMVGTIMQSWMKIERKSASERTSEQRNGKSGWMGWWLRHSLVICSVRSLQFLSLKSSNL